MTAILNGISLYAIPFILVMIPLYGHFKKIKVYECFVEGAKEGFQTAVSIIPFLVAMLFAIGMFRASGAMDLLTSALAPLTNMINMPAETLPMAIMRSLSGGGAQGLLVDLLATYGPDSFIGRMASVMMGSTETTFYIVAVYFGAIGVKKVRHTITAGLAADLASVLAAVFIVNMMFPM